MNHNNRTNNNNNQNHKISSQNNPNNDDDYGELNTKANTELNSINNPIQTNFPNFSAKYKTLLARHNNRNQYKKNTTYDFPIQPFKKLNIKGDRYKKTVSGILEIKQENPKIHEEIQLNKLGSQKFIEQANKIEYNASTETLRKPYYFFQTKKLCQAEHKSSQLEQKYHIFRNKDQMSFDNKSSFDQIYTKNPHNVHSFSNNATIYGEDCCKSEINNLNIHSLSNNEINCINESNHTNPDIMNDSLYKPNIHLNNIEPFTSINNTYNTCKQTLSSINQKEKNNPQNDNPTVNSFLPKQILSKLVNTSTDKPNIENLLDISNKSLEYFPNDFLNLTNIKVLKLDNNRIKSIPTNIDHLKNLEILSLSHNFLQELPITLSNLSNTLINLDIESNLLETFGDEITNLRNLQILNIYQNRITNFPISFQNLTNLTELIFEWFRYANPYLSVRQKRPDILNKIRELCLENAIINNKKSINFKQFLDKISENQVNLTYITDTNRSILHIASANEDISVVKFLISNYPNLMNLIDNDNYTPLSIAINRDRITSAKYLIRHKADLTLGGGHYSCPLHLAIKKMNYKIIKEMIIAGEYLDRQDIYGQSSLHYAMNIMANGNEEITKICLLLLENGANPNLKNTEGWAPIHIAIRKKDIKTINWIITYNQEFYEVYGRQNIFDLDCKGGPYNWTPMHIVAYSNFHDLVSLLADANCNMFKRSLNGYTSKRLITKKCLTLKLIEKYEIRWLKLNILDKTNQKANSNEIIIDQNIQNLHAKHNEIWNASKNKFHNSYLDIDNNDMNSSSSFNQYFPTKKNKILPSINANHMISMHNDDDLDDDIKSENDYETNLDDNTILDLDFKENISIINNDNLTIAKRDTDNGNDEDIDIEIAIRKRNNSSIDLGKILLMKNDKKQLVKMNNHMSIVNKLDLDVYNQNIFNPQLYINHIDYLNNYIKDLKIALIKKVIFTEKLIILNALRYIHYRNIEHIIKEYYNTDYYHENIKKNFIKTLYLDMSSKSKSIIHLQRITKLFDCIPLNLIYIFFKLKSISYENILIKCEICKLILEFNHVRSIESLEYIVANKNEHFLVKIEANQTLLILQKLKNFLQSCINSLSSEASFSDLHYNQDNNSQELRKFETLNPNDPQKIQQELLYQFDSNGQNYQINSLQLTEQSSKPKRTELILRRIISS